MASKRPAPTRPARDALHPRTIARRAALRALESVERGEWLNAALDTLDLPPAARPFARELSAGVLRHRSRLDWTLAPLLRKKLDRLDAPVRHALRLAAYERAFLHTPPPAVANEYAEMMRAHRLTSAVAFVNAIARRLPDEPREAPDSRGDPVAHLAIEFSHPAWLVERWLQRLGFDECAALCQANNIIAPLTLRVNTRRATRGEVLEQLKGRGLNAVPGQLSSDAILVQDAGSPAEWPEWSEGLLIVQDEAAQLVAQLAAPKPGDTVIDAAAAPGGKTTHLAQLMNDEGKIVACDPAPERLKLVRDNAARLRLNSIETQTGDFRALTTSLPLADLVLLDAPCLGTGTLRRRPDGKWRKTPEQLAELVVLQRELLEAAANQVRPGGALVYSTCSLEDEENGDQVRNFLQSHSGWMVETPAGMDAVRTSDGFWQTWPQHHGSDGMFAAKLRRIK